MNKISKIIWNKSTNMWVVVSELAKGRTKAKTNATPVQSLTAVFGDMGSMPKFALLPLMVALVAVGFSYPALADDGASVQQNEEETLITEATDDEKNPNIAVKEEAKDIAIPKILALNTSHPLQITRKSAANPNNQQNSLWDDEPAPVYDNGAGTRGKRGIDEDWIAHVKNSQGRSFMPAGAGKASVTNRQNSADPNDSNSQWATDFSVTTTEQGTPIGDASYISYIASGQNDSRNVVMIGKNTYVRHNPWPIEHYFTPGHSLTNTSNEKHHHHDVGAVAIGNFAYVSEGGVAVGPFAKVTARNEHGTATQAFGVAIGVKALARDGGVAIGPLAETKGIATIAIARQSYAGGDYAIALGSTANAKVKNSTAIGHMATAEGEGSIAFGNSENDPTNEKKYKRELATIAAAKNSMAFGTKAFAQSENSFAFGAESSALAMDAIAHGVKATASKENSMAFGTSAAASKKDSIAFGAESKALMENARSATFISTTFIRFFDTLY